MRHGSRAAAEDQESRAAARPVSLRTPHSEGNNADGGSGDGDNEKGKGGDTVSTTTNNNINTNERIVKIS